MDVMKSYPFPFNTHFAVTESLGIGYFEGIDFEFTQKNIFKLLGQVTKKNEGLQMEKCTIKNQHSRWKILKSL